jgi:glutathione S-transferase
MIVVHHLNNSRSQRILWLLEELGLPYDIKFYKRDAETNGAPEDLKAVHPLGRSPIITDGGKTVTESAAIIDYVIRHYAGAAFSRTSRTRPTTTTCSGCTTLRDRRSYRSCSR